MRNPTTPAVLLLIGLGCHHQPAQTALPAATGPVSLPAGTTLALTIAGAIDSASSSPGQTFAAVVSRDVTNGNGETLLANGSPVTLILLRTKASVFELRIASVFSNGGTYLVRNKSSAGSPSVGGASLGTFLGGIPGTEPPIWSRQNPAPPAQLMPFGKRIWVPDGSLLTFRLDQPVQLIGSP